MLSSQADPAPAEPLKQCAECQKSPKTLKQCAKCHSVWYCHKQCQKADWQQHKKDCSRLAGERSAGEGSRSTPASPSSDRPFTAIDNNTFLHNRPQKEVYRILVDMIRIRQWDTMKFDDNVMPGTIMSGLGTSLPAFHDLLQRVQAVDGFMPPWWKKGMEQECIRSSQDALCVLQDKADIQRSWNDARMPMKLRMLCENVYGWHPGVLPGSGARMLAAQVDIERTQAMAWHFDHVSANITFHSAGQ